MNKIQVLIASNLRGLVNQINAKQLQKEDILYITKEGDSFYLLYYGRE